MDTARLHVPLSRPPVVSQIGLNHHGRVPRERYHMHGLWGLHLYQYAGAVRIGTVRHAFAAGSVTVTPPDIDLEWEFPRGARHYYCLFAVPGDGPLEPLPVVTPAADPATYRAQVAGWEDAIRTHATRPWHSAAWVWHQLCALAPRAADHPRVPAAGVPTVADGDVPPAIQNLLRLITEDPAVRYTLGGMAHRSGISPNHLIRLFRAHCGCTPMAWVRRQRAEHARALLTTSSLPISTIAGMVGVPDRQRFNKLMRRECGAAPSRLRGR